MIAKKEIIRLAQERINELDNGNYLVDVNISSKNAINVRMDNLHGGVSVKDCVSVSRNIEHNLDRELEDFELQVSSPGIDQPFMVQQQYLKNVGRNVTVTTFSEEIISGELIKADQKEISIKEIKTEKGVVKLNYKGFCENGEIKSTNKNLLAFFNLFITKAEFA